MAIGMVAVFPGMFPATIRVAPNSPMALAKERTAPAIIPFLDRGENHPKKCFKFSVTERVRNLDEVCVHGLNRCPSCFDHQGKGYNKGSQHGSIPRKHDTPASPMKEIFPHQTISSHKQN